MTPYSKSKHPVRDAAILTTGYVAGTEIGFDRQNYLAVLVDFTKGSLTSLQVKIESSVDEGVTYGTQVTETASGGEVTIDAAEYSFDTTGNYWIVISPMLADKVKISVKGTGTVTSSSCTVTAVTGSV
jgi:hypothetical protein